MLVRERVEKSNAVFAADDAASEIGVTIFDDGHVGVILTTGERVLHIALSAPGARAVAARLVDAAAAIESHGKASCGGANVH